jgi:predicted dienelactone hydrolase
MIHPLRVVALTLVLLPLTAAADSPRRCHESSGDAAFRCLRRYASEVVACRKSPDGACEQALRVAGGRLDTLVAGIEEPVRTRCTDQSAAALDYFDLDDAVLRTANACRDFAEDLLGVAFADDPGSLSAAARTCQTRVAQSLTRLEARIVRLFGPRCFVPGFARGACDRAARDARVAAARDAQIGRIGLICGGDFDALGLSTLEPATSSLNQRIAEVVERVVTRATHFAQQVYPPNDLGPAAAFGEYAVGVTTLALADASRSNVQGTGPRPVLTEVYYPSTAAAVAGLPRDVVTIFGIPIVATPASRDVARAPGAFPLVVFSHGNNGLRIQSFFFAAHLASHGFVVATPDHHGNTFLDSLAGVVDPDPARNRPRDMRFLIDEMLAASATPGDRFEGAVDGARIGASGHSFGGYTAFALAGGASGLGTFTDPRVRAIFPQAPSAPFDEAFFAGITIPTLIVGGSIDETTPFGEDQQRPFDNLPSGASVVGLGALVDGGHFTFSDFCEVDRALLGFLGGFEEACEPRHLPWRHAHDIVNYLSLSFFDGVLNGNAGALARLDPAKLATIDDLVWTGK